MWEEEKASIRASAAGMVEGFLRQEVEKDRRAKTKRKEDERTEAQRIEAAVDHLNVIGVDLGVISTATSYAFGPDVLGCNRGRDLADEGDRGAAGVSVTVTSEWVSELQRRLDRSKEGDALRTALYGAQYKAMKSMSLRGVTTMDAAETFWANMISIRDCVIQAEAGVILRRCALNGYRDKKRAAKAVMKLLLAPLLPKGEDFVPDEILKRTRKSVCVCV